MENLYKDMDAVKGVCEVLKDKESILPIIDAWESAKHPRDENGRFSSSGSSGSSDNLDSMKSGKPIGGLSPKDYRKVESHVDFDDDDYIKKGVQFNLKQANARKLALRQIIKNPKNAKKYAYLWMDS